MKRPLGWAVLLWMLSAGAVAQLPQERHVPWDDLHRRAAAVIDRHVLDDTGDRFRRLTDNADRVHLTIGFGFNGSRSIQLAVPASWGEEKALAVATQCAGLLQWPLLSRRVSDAGESLIASVAGVHRHERIRVESIPWPALVAALKSAGASRAELRVLTSGLPISSHGSLRGWTDAGNAAMEIWVLACDTDSPPFPSRITVGFTRSFVASRLAIGVVTLCGGVGAMLALYLLGLSGATVGRGGITNRALKWGSLLFAVVWLFEIIVLRMAFLVTLLPLPSTAQFVARLFLLVGPPLLVYLFGFLLRLHLRSQGGICPPARTPVPAWFTIAIAICGGGLGVYMAVTGRASATSPLHSFGIITKWLLPGFLALNGVLWVVIQLVRGQPRTLVGGELLDRFRELADTAGVTVATFQVTDGRFVRANGLATAGGAVVLTRPALLYLPKEQVDALVAHELAHLKLQHVQKRVHAFFGLMLPCALFGAWEVLVGHLGFAALAILGGPLAMIVCSPLMRRQEFEADALGAELSGDPRAAMRLYAAIARLNGSRLELPHLVECISSHPSFARRIRAVAARFGVAPEEADRLMAEAGRATDRSSNPLPVGVGYDLPDYRFVAASARPTARSV